MERIRHHADLQDDDAHPGRTWSTFARAPDHRNEADCQWSIALPFASNVPGAPLESESVDQPSVLLGILWW